LIQASIPAPEKSTFSLARDDAAGPAVISPAGHYLAFVASNEGGTQQLWIRDLAQNVSSPLQGTEEAAYPFWSPDEQSIGFFAESKLKRVGIHGGAVLPLCNTDRARGGSWGTGGNIIFTPDSQTTLSVVSERGGTPRPVTRMQSYHTTHRWPVFLPDGRHFLYLASNHNAPDASEVNGIYVGSPDSESRFLLPANSSFAVASGYLLFLQNDALMAQPFDAARAQLTGAAVPLGPRVHRNPGTWRGGFDASSSGVLAYHPATGENGSQLLWIDRNGKTLGPRGERDVIRSISVSPDARRVAVEAGDPMTVIWIYDAIRGTRSRLTVEGTGDASPVWSPDGSRIAFAQRHGGPYDVYVKNSNFSGAQELVFASPENKSVLDWSPDGRSLLISMGRPAALWLLPLTGEKKAQPLLRGPSPIWGGAFSPDGRWLAYATDESGRQEIYVTRFPSVEGKWQVSSNGGRDAAWRRDGKAVFYLARDGSLTEAELGIHGDDLEVSGVRPLFKFHFANLSPLSERQYAATQDGRFLTIKPEEEFSTVNLMIHWTAALQK
jgi:Tol biopolymer transport system component